MHSTPVVCDQCGAASAADANCRLCFEALLAFEAERPAVFAAVHHLTVAVYSLQHPAGYGPAVIAAWHALVADVLDGRTTPTALRRRHARQFAGAKRVLEPGALAPVGWPTRWPMTVQDVFNPLAPMPSEEDYIARAHAWAEATRSTIDLQPRMSIV